jgi:hypothetical protein
MLSGTPLEIACTCKGRIDCVPRGGAKPYQPIEA